MVTFNDLTESFTRINPGQFISKFQDWIIFTLLLFFFWAVAGIALRRRFEQSRYLRVLITTIAIMFAVGTYFSIYKGWLKFSFEGFGFLGVVLVFIVALFIVIGLIRAYGVKASKALSIGYALFYISIWAVSPSILDTIDEVFPLLNIILLFLFIVSVIKAMAVFINNSKSPISMANELFHKKIKPKDEVEIEKEIDYEKQERKYIKAKTIRLTKRELKTVDHIDHYLKEIENVLTEGTSLTDYQKKHIVNALFVIGKTRNDFLKGLERLDLHIKRYKGGDEVKVNELRKRFHETQERKKKVEIQKAWLIEKKKLEIYDFLKANNEKIVGFLKTFDLHIQKAVRLIEINNPTGARYPIKTARNNIGTMKDVLKKLKRLEFYLLKFSKNEERTLQNEKKV
jgi:hypothetical protein